MALFYTFGGFSQERTAKELLFGYKDPFVTTLVSPNPQKGGDPSANPFVAFNDPNSTLEAAQITGKQSMYTGIGNHKKVRQYRDFFSYDTDYITFNKSIFDGNKTSWELANPWINKSYLKGSDGGAFPPIEDEKETLYVYLSSVFKIGALDYSG